MPKHNNVIPNVHLRKHWEFRVKTFYDQAGRKKARREARAAKAAALFPRPVEALRPVVRGQTVKYNSKQRIGRGFSLAELKAAGVSAIKARTMRIAVDHRRRSASQESVEVNAQRLKEFLSKVTFDATEMKNATQIKGTVMPIKRSSTVVEFRKPTAEEKQEGSVYEKLRKLRADVRLVGVRAKLAVAKATAAKEKEK
jgi:large subunit ribosomal protein L13e